jgi:hypothetical protein
MNSPTAHNLRVELDAALAKVGRLEVDLARHERQQVWEVVMAAVGLVVLGVAMGWHVWGVR